MRLKRKRPRGRKSLRAVRDERGDLSRGQLVSIHAAMSHVGVHRLLRDYRYGDNAARPHRGRPELLSAAAIFTVLAALVEIGEAPLLANVAHAIRYRLDRDMADTLQIPSDVYALERDPEHRTYWDLKGTIEQDEVKFLISADKVYDRVQASFDRLTSLIEPYPGLAGREALPWGEVERKLDALDPADVAFKQERLIKLVNTVLTAALARFGRYERRAFLRAWNGDVAVDGTKVPIWTEKGRGGVPVDKRKSHPEWIHHAEPMGRYYVREGNHAGFEDDGVTPLKKGALDECTWAYELHLAVAVVPTGAKKTWELPNLALGMSFDAPAGRIAENSLTTVTAAGAMCESMGIEPGFVVGDRAILPNSIYEKLQQQLRRSGWKICADYRVDQLGKIKPVRKQRRGQRGTVESRLPEADPLRGMIMVEGDFYCPGMPEALVNAERDYRDGTIDEETRDERVARRAAFLATRKEPLNAEGRGRFACPATTRGGGAICPLRGAAPDNKVRIEVENPPEHPGEICTTRHASVAITLDSTTGKYAQDLRYRTHKWRRMWGARNQVESFNSALKEEGHEELENAARRRVRGFAKQALLTALMVYSVNVRRLRDFIHDVYTHGEKLDLADADEPPRESGQAQSENSTTGLPPPRAPAK